MTTIDALDRFTGGTPLAFTLDPEHEAHEPPEARGLRRDGGRLLVSRGPEAPIDGRFTDIARILRAGDVVVVNTSGTVPAALDGRLSNGEPVVVHLSGEMPGGMWLVEARGLSDAGTVPLRIDEPLAIELFAGGHVRLLARFATSQRLWLAQLDLDEPVAAYAARHGRPIRYRHVPREWPLGYYQTVFATEPGSAEMPSASRPFTPEVVTDLVRRGVLIAPLVLHAGVSSLEGGEAPHPERYRVPVTTAAVVNAARDAGGRVIAAGTTVVRALATVTDEHGVVHPGEGWTELVVTPETPVRSVDGLLTGWHEPDSTHLMMLESFAGRHALETAYAAALEHGYLWHEFGDSHLILPGTAAT